MSSTQLVSSKDSTAPSTVLCYFKHAAEPMSSSRSDKNWLRSISSDNHLPDLPEDTHGHLDRSGLVSSRQVLGRGRPTRHLLCTGA
eukprot:1966278-Prorocentrum_lima.AAC.1